MPSSSASWYRIWCSLVIISSCFQVAVSSINDAIDEVHHHPHLLRRQEGEGRILQTRPTTNGVDDVSVSDAAEQQQPVTLHKITVNRNGDQEETDDADEGDQGENEQGDNGSDEEDDDVGEFMFVDRVGNPINGNCFPLKLVSESQVQTDIGLVCAKFKDASQQEKLQVTFNTTMTDYVLVEAQLTYGHSPDDYPRLVGSQQPDIARFEHAKVLPQAQNVIVFDDIEMDPNDDMKCYSTEEWVKYFVAHAMVRLQNEGPETSRSVYGDGGVLYIASNNVPNGAGENVKDEIHTSYFTMKLQCTPTPEPTSSPTAAPTKSEEEAAGGGFRADAGGLFLLQPTSAPSVTTGSPTIASIATTTAAPSESPSESIPITSSPTTGEIIAETTTPGSPQPSSSPSFYPTASPTGTVPPASLRAQKMVIGTSFIFITENSGQELPHQIIQSTFQGFARNILEEMRVSPIETGQRQRRLGGRPTSATTSNQETIRRRRHLEVLYDDSSFTVYDFLVNEDCIPNDEHAQAVQKSSASDPPPSSSQCHRAYARYSIELIDENPTEVCKALREGTLAGYYEGRLQDAHDRQFPNSNIIFQAGDFEYCIPLEDFVVPDHGDTKHWLDGNPLANLTTVRDDVEDANDDTPWYLPLIIGASLLFLLLLIIFLICRYKRNNEKHKRREAKLAREQSSR